MNWLQLLIPVIQAIIQRLLERKLNPDVVTTREVEGEGGKKATQELPPFEDHKTDDMVRKLEQAKHLIESQPKTANRAVGDTGLIQKVEDLIAAVKSKDSGKMIAAVMAILQSL